MFKILKRNKISLDKGFLFFVWENFKIKNYILKIKFFRISTNIDLT